MGNVRKILPYQRKLAVRDETGAAECEWRREVVCQVLTGKYLENILGITPDRVLAVAVVPVNEV